MASSTYALPVNPTAQAYGHGHSQSHYLADHQPSWGQMNGHSLPGGGHRHHQSDVNGQLRAQESSPYANSHDHAHTHSPERSRTAETSFTLKPLMGGRPKGRPRGESDLGRPPSRMSATSRKFGFSPIHEAPAPPSSSWLELPEALTALLIPLPYLFASLAYPSIASQGRRLPSSLNPSEHLLESVTNEASIESLANSSPLLHACTLSSTTLILVGVISKIRSMTEQPLDRRKSFGNSGDSGGTFDVLYDVHSIGRVVTNILGILLPFYATMQLGGTRTALILLVAVVAGLGGLDHKPGKHTLLDSIKRTLRTRKSTIGTLLLGVILDVSVSATKHGAILGHLALATSILVVPPPLPATGWSLKTSLRGANAAATRVSLPKPSSPLIGTVEDTLLTLVAGVLMTLFTVLFSIVSSSSPSLAHHEVFFSTLSVASAAGLIFFSLPAALRTEKKAGLALSSLLVTAFGVYEHPYSWQAWAIFPLISAVSFGAVSFDTRTAMARPHSHSHSHSGHKHSHSHDHHLHGNHSKLSAFLISQCTPGSIVHSIMIEKDSRRIAYFAMLNLGFMLVQFFYGFVSGSLGLLTDSIHMLFDCAGLAVGLAAAVMSKWPPNARFPYGYGKIDTLSGFANGVFLMLVSVEIIFDAFERLWEGHELQRLNELLIVSVLGFLVNIVGLTAFGHAHHGHGHSHDHDHGHGDHGHSHGHHHHDNENMQGIFLHILADALGSVAVIISTALTKYYGWSGWDPIASGIIAILIFFSAIPLVKSSGMRLLLSLPADIEYSIRNTLQELSSLRGVIGYTVPKFWLEDEGAAHSEVHAKEHAACDHDHDHDHGHSHDRAVHDHGHDAHLNSSPHSHHAHDHSNAHQHDHHDHHDQHDHHNHDHDHDHDHSHAPRGKKVLGVIHIIASRIADPEDVRERTVQFLKGRGMDVVVHVEKEGEGRCWCGGGHKMG